MAPRPLTLPKTQAALKKWAEKEDLAALEALLTQFDDAYTNTDAPLVSDAVYDTLKDVYLSRVPAGHPRTVGAPPPKSTLMVRLPYHMGSLDKVKTQKEIDTWMARGHAGPYVLSNKMDGLSGLLVLSKDHAPQLLTRGGGVEGQDVSYLLQFITGLPDLTRLAKTESLPLAIRGELIMPVQDFERGDGTGQPYGANPRAVVAGIAKVAATPGSRKRTEAWKAMARHVHFLPYAILSSPTLPLDGQFEQLFQWDFEVVRSSTRPDVSAQSLTAHLERERVKSPFEMDGLVVSVRRPVPSSPTDPIPKDAFAFKLGIEDQESAETNVEEVQWNVSKDGLLKPRLRVLPVVINGVTITYVTGVNANYMEEMGLGVGAVIRIVRSGDVIPTVQQVIQKAKVALPTGKGIHWDTTHTDLVSDTVSTDVIVKRLAHAIKTLGVDGVSEETMAKCVHEGGFTRLVDLLTAPPGAIAALKGLGPSMEAKIRSEVPRVLHAASFSTLLVASTAFGHGVGVKVLDKVFEARPGLTPLDALPDLTGIPGIGPALREKIQAGWADGQTFVREIAPWRAKSQVSSLSPPRRPSKAREGSLAGQVIVFTGFRSKDLETQIEAAGGNVGTSITGKTTMVVYAGDRVSTKLKAAEDRGLTVIPRTDFERRFD